MLNNDKENIKKIYLDEVKKNEIIIDIPNSLSTSEDDQFRKELLWNSKLDNLMEEYMNTCNNLSIKHSIKSKKYKKLHILFSIPGILISVVLTGISQYIEHYTIITTLSIIVMGLTGGLNTFFNFAKKTEQHSQYENLYLEVYNDIHSEINKPKAHRVSADMYLERIKNKINYLKLNSPDT